MAIMTRILVAPTRSPRSDKSGDGHRAAPEFTLQHCAIELIECYRELEFLWVVLRRPGPDRQCALQRELRRTAPGCQRTSTFLNCQGSDVSMSSGNSPGRSVSGVQSV